nr:VP1 [Cambodia Culex birnavirus]
MLLVFLLFRFTLHESTPVSMSDIFNQQSLKQAMTTIIRAQGASEQDNLMLYLQSLRVDIKPATSEITWAELPAYLHSRGAKLYKPRQIRVDELVDPETVLLPNVLEVLQRPGGLNMPVGEGGYIPSYRPSHETLPPLETAVNAIAYHTALLQTQGASDAQFQAYIKVAEDLVSVINTYRFSTGTLSGQANRLLDAYAVRNGKNGNHANKTLSSQGLTALALVDLLEDTLPIAKHEATIPLMYQLQKYIYTPEQQEITGEPTGLPPVHGNNAAGLPFLGKKKKERTLEALALADGLIREVSALLKEAQTTKTSAAGIALTDPAYASLTFSREVAGLLTKEYWYMMCGTLFPKGETYDQTKLDKKTRNIWSASYVLHLIANMVSYRPMESALNCMNCTADTPSLAKFSATQGGMDAFVQILLSADEPKHFIYADNIYLYYPDDDEWYSIDLTKGEANVTQEMSMAVAIYLLRNGWCTDDGDPLFNMTWAFIAMYIVPLCSVDSICLLMNLQIKNPGQGSGCPWTFIHNHACSTVLAHAWIKRGKPKPTPENIEILAKDTGIDFKLELRTNNIKERLLAAQKRMVPVGDKRTVREIIPMDLLGWDVTYTEFGFTPVLSYERLLKSIVCPQPSSSTFDTPLKKNIHKYVQSVANSYVGAWAYPNLNSMVKEYTTNYWNSIQNQIRGNQKGQQMVTDLMVKTINQSAYQEALSFLDPESPLHEQDWPAKLFGKKPIEKKEPRRFSRREYLGPGNAKARSTRLARARAEGKFFENQALSKIAELMERIDPETRAAVAAVIPSGKGREEIDLLVGTTLELARRAVPGPALASYWEKAYLGELEPAELSSETGIYFNTAADMAIILPPYATGLVTDNLFAAVTGQRPPATQAEAIAIYSPIARELNLENWIDKLRSDELARRTQKYITLSEAAIEVLLHPAAIPRTKFETATPSQAANPYVEYGIAAESPYGALDARGPRTKGQKRRETRKRQQMRR